MKPQTHPLFPIAAVLYWAGIFVLTHLPPSDLPPGFPHADKIVHFAMYAGLAVIVPFTFGWKARGWMRWAAVFAAYGLFDEWSQPFFLRSFEWWDWAADSAGIACGLGVLRWRSSLKPQ